jgi:LysM repeat protein
MPALERLVGLIVKKFRTLGVALLFLVWSIAWPGQAYAYFAEDDFASCWNQSVPVNQVSTAQQPSASLYEAAPGEPRLTHQVASGDTLWSLARYYRVDLTRLMAVNKISDPGCLIIGRELIIPGGGAQQPEAYHAADRGGDRPLLEAPAQSQSLQLDGPFSYGLDIARAMVGIMRVESRCNPYTIYDNTANESYSFTNLSEYLATGRRLLAADHDIDMGLMQINSANGVSLEQAVDPGFAINWAGSYLQSVYRQTGSLNTAIRAYNGGPGGTDLPQTYNYLTRVLNAEVSLASSAPKQVVLAVSDRNSSNA